MKPYGNEHQYANDWALNATRHVKKKSKVRKTTRQAMKGTRRMQDKRGVRDDVQDVPAETQIATASGGPAPTRDSGDEG